MIINSKTDLDNAPEDTRARFLRRLAAGVKRWTGEGGEWKLTEHTRHLKKFGLTVDDLPDVPEPPKPDYNPDERAREQLATQLREQRDDKLRATDYTVLPDYPLSDSERDEVTTYRQALRDVPQQEGFPGDVTWPKEPSVLE